MSKIEYRFNIAAMLLASVLAALAISDAHAGSKKGASGGAGTNARAAGPTLMGGKGGISGRDVRSRGSAATAGGRHEPPGRGSGAHTTGGAAGGIDRSRK